MALTTSSAVPSVKPKFPTNGYPQLAEYGLKEGPNTLRLNPYLQWLERAEQEVRENPEGQLANAATPDARLDVDQFAQGLLNSYSVTSIDCHRCGITPDGAFSLAQVVSNTKFLQEVSLSRQRFGNKGALPLAEALKANQTVKHLNLSWNELRDEFAGLLAEALTMNNSLQSIHLDKNSLGEDGAGAIAISLTSNKKLRYLSLSQNKINAAGCGILGEGLVRCSHLVSLDLSYNAITNEGVFNLFTALAQPGSTCRLTTLNLAYNKIGPAVVALSTYLQSPGSRSLKELNLEYSYLNLGDEWSLFCNMIAQNKCVAPLVNFSVARNTDLGDKGVSHLIEALCKSSKLRSSILYLDLTEVCLTAEGLSQISGKIFPTGSQEGGEEGLLSLATLHLSENKLPGSEYLLGAALMKNTAPLNFIGLGYCHLSDMESFCKGLKENTIRSAPRNNVFQTGPKQWYLRGNKFAGEESLQLFARWLQIYERLEYLDFSNNPTVAELNERKKLRSVMDSFFDVFDMNKNLSYIILSDTTIVTPQRLLNDSWDGTLGVLPVDTKNVAQEIGLPPLCSTSIDLLPASSSLSGTGSRGGEAIKYAPSEGFSTYSITCGSSMKRQFEKVTCFPHVGLFPFVGKPVKHLSSYVGPYQGALPKDRDQQTRINSLVAEDEGQYHEENIGGLLMSEDQLRREFNKLDQNGNGYLEKEELKGVLRSLDDLGCPMSERQLEWFVSKYSGTDNRVSFEEFCTIYLKVAQF